MIANKLKVKNEDSPIYNRAGNMHLLNPTQEYLDNDIVCQALGILERRMTVAGTALGDPSSVKAYLQLKLAELEHEVFVCLFLDAQHRIIAYEEMFRGTINQTSVYPREVVKAALAHNASAIIFAHNHPSGSAEPSRSDEIITQSLKGALSLVDVRTLDHVIVGKSQTMSFAERGLI
jgi:DNA repair protein RadC